MFKKAKQFLNLFKHFTITGGDGTPYLTRWFLFSCPLFKIYLHKIHRSDEDCHHNHPWNFKSLILSGSYWEESFSVKDPSSRTVKKFGPFSINSKNRNIYHKVLLGESPVWTLVFIGPKRSEWNFCMPLETGGYAIIHNMDYMDMKFGKGNWRSVDDSE
jgi:hypothetical protein